MPASLSALRHGLDHEVGDDARSLAGFLAEAFGPTTVAVVHYGSRAQGRPTRPESAYDFFVVVDRYPDGYQSLSATVGTGYSPGTASRLARVLAPNVIAVTQPDGETERRAKCCVVSLRDFQRACSSRPRDHFTQGRLIQFVLLAWTRDAASAETVSAAISSARAHSLDWGRPSLPAQFTVDEFLYRVLRRSLSGEIRPESGDHAATLVSAQRDTLHAIYAPFLAHMVDAGALEAGTMAGTYRLATGVSAWEAWRVRWYFQRSKVRATTRLLKHVILYEGWLDYIVKKIDRSGGESIELTARERRWPLIFLWPKVFRYLRTRPQRRQ